MPKIDRVHNIGEIIDSAYTEIVGTSALTSAAIPGDNSIPQISEGVQIFSLSITPKKIGNKIRIIVNCYANELSNIGNMLTFALFKNTDADAIATGALSVQGVNNGNTFIVKEVTVTNLNTLTFTVRAGNEGGATTLTLNSVNNSTANINYGNSLVSFMKLEEVLQ